MRFDSLSMFCDAQAFTGSGKDGDKIVDLGKNGLGNPPHCYVTILVSEAFSGAATITLKGSDDKSAWKDILSTGSMAKEALVAGTIINLPVPFGHPRYLKLNVEGTSLTAGTITAGIQLAPQTPIEKTVFESEW